MVSKSRLLHKGLQFKDDRGNRRNPLTVCKQMDISAKGHILSRITLIVQSLLNRQNFVKESLSYFKIYWAFCGGGIVA